MSYSSNEMYSTVLYSLQAALSFKYIFYLVFSSKETNDGKSFETVKHGSRTLENLADRGPQLDLGNKFDALRRS